MKKKHRENALQTIKRFMDVEHEINIKNKMEEKQDTA